MNRLQNIPFSIAVVYFTFVFLYFAVVDKMEPWLAVFYGVIILVDGLMLWFDFARGRRSEKDAGD